MADFKIAKPKILKVEGGYVNDPTDKGGETYKGIARKANPNWVGWKMIDTLKRNNFCPKLLDDNKDLSLLVDDFYKALYWDPLRLDEMLHQGVAQELFDISVNMGVSTAGLFAQRAINLLNQAGNLFANIDVDGKIGRHTLTIINNYQRVPALIRTLNLLQGERYIEICRNDESQERFFVGWILNRTNDTL